MRTIDEGFGLASSYYGDLRSESDDPARQVGWRHRIEQAYRFEAALECIRAARDSCEDTLDCHLAVLRLGAQYFLDRPDFLRMCCHDGYSWAARLPASSSGNDLWDEGASSSVTPPG